MTEGALVTAKVKLTPGVRAVTAENPGAVAVLHVTLSAVPREKSSATPMMLFAVTALVSTVTVPAAAAITKNPDAAEPHTAGEAELAHSVAVPIVLNVFVPVKALVAARVGTIEKLPLLNEHSILWAVESA